MHAQCLDEDLWNIGYYWVLNTGTLDQKLDILVTTKHHRTNMNNSHAPIE